LNAIISASPSKEILAVSSTDFSLYVCRTRLGLNAPPTKSQPDAYRLKSVLLTRSLQPEVCATDTQSAIIQGST